MGTLYEFCDTLILVKIVKSTVLICMVVFCSSFLLCRTLGFLCTVSESRHIKEMVTNAVFYKHCCKFSLSSYLLDPAIGSIWGRPL